MPVGLPQGPGRPNRRPKGEDEEEDVPDEDLFDETVHVPSGEELLRPRVFNPTGPHSSIRPLLGDVDTASNRPGSEAGSQAEHQEPEEEVEQEAPGEETENQEGPPIRVSKLSSGAGFSVLLTPAEKDEGPSRFSWFPTASNNSFTEAPKGTLARQQSKGSSNGEEIMSMMSGSEVNVEVSLPLNRFSYVLAAHEKDEMSGGESEEELDEVQEEAPEDPQAPSQEELRRHSFDNAVEKGVHSLEMLQRKRGFMWKETFGYRADETLFPSFLKARDKDIAQAISAWPLNPERLYDAPSESRVKANLQTDLPGELHDGLVRDEGRKARLSKLGSGLLHVAGVWTSSGVQFFYIDMATGPFCIFPEKAMVMELWRNQRLIHVGAVLMSNDWKAGRGAFGRFASGGVEVQQSDKVAFPTYGQFHRNFQDFMDSCVGQAGES